jgi:hypothetical protein
LKEALEYSAKLAAWVIIDILAEAGIGFLPSSLHSKKVSQDLY